MVKGQHIHCDECNREFAHTDDQSVKLAGSMGALILYNVDGIKTSVCRDCVKKIVLNHFKQYKLVSCKKCNRITLMAEDEELCFECERKSGIKW